jgi:tRNA G10  N-methylase Trm11
LKQKIIIRTNQIYELIHQNDEQKLRKILQSKICNKRFETYCSWYVTNLKKKMVSNNDLQVIKMSGKFIPNSDLFIAFCEPMLRCFHDIAIHNCSESFSSSNKFDLKFLNLDTK